MKTICFPMYEMSLSAFVANSIERGMLTIDIERIRQLLVGIHRYPIPNRQAQTDRVAELTRIFKALLEAKERLSLEPGR